jgi:inosine-uridine nucleoside N-ribohydrolase
VWSTLLLLAASCLVLAVFARPAAAAPRQPVPIILDTDIGDDIDDTWALAMLLQRPEVDVRLIVTALNDTHAKTRLVAKMLDRLGRTDIPIGTGVRTSSQPLNQARWLGRFSLSSYEGVVHPDGVAALITSVHESAEPITIVAIGAHTNLAEALKRDPSIAQKARLVAMAGSIHIGYGGLKKRSAEVNVISDIEAFQTTLAAPWPSVWAPLDSCGTVALSAEEFAPIRASKHPAARLVVENYDLWANRGTVLGEGTSILYDTVAAYLAYDGSLCQMADVAVRVDDQGYTIPDEQGRVVSCALGWRNRKNFIHHLVETFTSSAIAETGAAAGKPGNAG